MKTKALLIAVMICITAITYGQAKKTPIKKNPKPKTNVPVVKTEKYPEPPVVEVILGDPGTNNVNASPTMVEAPKQIRLFLTDGKMLTVRKVSELKNLDFKTIKLFDTDNNYNPELEEVAFNAFLKNILNESPNLEKLNLPNCKIKTLPEIYNLNTKITKLNLSNNELTTLPKGIEKYINLEVLNIDNNKFSALPKSLAQLTKLNWLSMNENQFTKFPEQIFEIPSLEMINMYRNNIYTIPDKFDLLPNLKILNVQYNKIDKLPSSLSTLKMLRKISISGNLFKAFPASVAVIPTLTDVDFSNNPIEKTLFMKSLDAIKWQGMLSLYNLNLTEKEYKAVDEKLKFIDVSH